MRVAEGDLSLAHGAGIVVPPGSAHQMCNIGDVECRFLVVSAPPMEGDRIDAVLPPQSEDDQLVEPKTPAGGRAGTGTKP